MDIFGYQVSLTAIVAIISALGVIGALVFNGLTLRRDQKSRHYQAFMDLQKERDEIQMVYPEIVDIIQLKPTEVANLPVERKNKLRTYQWKFIQFHDKVAHLALTGVIPKSIPKYFEDTFPSAFTMIDFAVQPDVVRESAKYLLEWCKREKIIVER